MDGSRHRDHPRIHPKVWTMSNKGPIIIQRLGYGLDAIVWGLMITLLLIAIRIHSKLGDFHQDIKSAVIAECGRGKTK